MVAMDAVLKEVCGSKPDSNSLKRQKPKNFNCCRKKLKTEKKVFVAWRMGTGGVAVDVVADSHFCVGERSSA